MNFVKITLFTIGNYLLVCTIPTAIGVGIIFVKKMTNAEANEKELDNFFKGSVKSLGVIFLCAVIILTIWRCI